MDELYGQIKDLEDELEEREEDIAKLRELAEEVVEWVELSGHYTAWYYKLKDLFTPPQPPATDEVEVEIKSPCKCYNCKSIFDRSVHEGQCPVCQTWNDDEVEL